MKTLMAYYGSSHVADLSYWTAATSTHNTTNATTGATLSSHATRTATWNGTNTAGVVQPDGTYTVKIEMTENEGTGKLASYTFVKGTAAATGTVATASANISNVSLAWAPTNTALDEVKLASLYTVYPNPTRSTIYVNGGDVNGIEIYSVSDRRLLKTNQQQANLAKLPKGVYMAQIYTDKGIFIKKIIKE